LETGQPEMLNGISDQMLAAAPMPESRRAILQQLSLRCYLIAPLVARGRMLGAVTFALAESGRDFGSEDLSLAQELAHRAALAIDNSRLYRELQHADQRKDEFLAMLAHELRNPLAPMRNVAEVLKLRGFDDPALVRARELMERQTGNLTRLVDDLLDVSRITRGKIDLRKEPVEISSFVRRVGDAYLPIFQAFDHQFEVTVPPEPLWLEADPTRLEQIIGNLLNNAAKYTEPGGRIDLAVTVACANAGHPSSIVVSVRDTGIGIREDLLPRVFDLFIQDHRTLDRAQGGLGIGLTLVRNLTEMHGGRVEARSHGPGRGSEFLVYLPAGVRTESGPLPDRASLNPSAPAVPLPGSRRVLVVDDNQDAAETLAELLELWGYDVLIAHDGESGLQAAETFRPEIGILDIGLPHMNGYELAKRLRGLEGAPEPAALLPAPRAVAGKSPRSLATAGSGPAHTGRMLLAALTGYGQEEDRRRAREAGFDYHFTKPVDIEALRRALQRP
ncbi:MAG TPA: ATP-binding protein, partial [Armatimonadota bacterium]|nr:ATP-binding protein [Armatimonadota bacterium]